MPTEEQQSPPDAGAPIRYLKEYGSVIILIVMGLGAFFALRSDIQARPTLAKVMTVVREQLAVHSLVPHPSTGQNLDKQDAFIRVLDKRLDRLEAQQGAILEEQRRDTQEIKRLLRQNGRNIRGGR